MAAAAKKKSKISKHETETEQEIENTSDPLFATLNWQQLKVITFPIPCSFYTFHSFIPFECEINSSNNTIMTS